MREGARGRPGAPRGHPGGDFGGNSRCFWSSEFARTFSHRKNTNVHRLSRNFRHPHPCGEQFGLAPRGVCSTSACWPKNARVDSKILENPHQIDLKSRKIPPRDPPRATSGEKIRSKKARSGLSSDLGATRADSGRPGSIGRSIGRSIGPPYSG